MNERLTVTCPAPRTLASGEAECPACGRIWDLLDGRPECDRRAPEIPEQTRARSAGQQKLTFRRHLHR